MIRWTLATFVVCLVALVAIAISPFTHAEAPPTTSPATQPAAEIAPAVIAAPSMPGIAVVRTWDELGRQPAIDLPDGAKVRFGIDTATCADNGCVVVYALFDGLSIYTPFANQDVGEFSLGPLRAAPHRVMPQPSDGSESLMIESDHESSDPRLIRVSAGRHLFAAMVPMHGARLMNIDIKSENGKRVAVTDVESANEKRHRWLGIKAYRLGSQFVDNPLGDEDYVKKVEAAARSAKPIVEKYDAQVFGIEYGQAIPMLVGEYPLWSETEDRPIAGTRELPSLQSRRRDTIKATFEDGMLQLALPGGIPMDVAAEQLVLRWWVNGEEVKPISRSREMSFTSYNTSDTHSAVLASPLRLRFGFDPSFIGAKPGDRVRVQAMYTPFGITVLDGNEETVKHCFPSIHEHQDRGDEESNGAPAPIDAPSVPGLGYALATSNPVEFVASQPARIPAVRTWGELLKQKPVDIGGGASVRVGIESASIPSDGRAFVYVLAHWPARTAREVHSGNLPWVGPVRLFIETEATPLADDHQDHRDFVEDAPQRVDHVKLDALSDENGELSGLYIGSVTLRPRETGILHLRGPNGELLAQESLNGIELSSTVWMTLGPASEKGKENAAAPATPTRITKTRAAATRPADAPATQPTSTASSPAVSGPAYAPFLAAAAWPTFSSMHTVVRFDSEKPASKPAWIADDTPLPALISPDSMRACHLRVEGDCLVVTSDEPMIFPEGEHGLTSGLLVSISVLGDPFQPIFGDATGAQPAQAARGTTPTKTGTARGKGVTQVKIPLRLDADLMRLHHGSRVSLRVMYCPLGWERAHWPKILDSAVSKASPLPRVSNAVEIVVK